MVTGSSGAIGLRKCMEVTCLENLNVDTGAHSLFYHQPMILVQNRIRRGGEWYLKKRGSRKILAGSQNLGSVVDKSRSLVFSWFAFTFFESRNFSPKSLQLGFLTRISASQRVSDFTIHHPYQSLKGSVTHHYPNFR